MQASIRQSVDLSLHPDLIVIMLGFEVRNWRGFLTLFSIGRGLRSISQDMPEGLLSHEQFLFSPRQVGIRQYWRDLASLEQFTRSAPHSDWWRSMNKLREHAGFWHETYSRTGEMEALYVNMKTPMGFARFADAQEPVGPFLSARQRMNASRQKSA